MSNSLVNSDTHGIGIRSGPVPRAAIEVIGRQLERINHRRLVRRDINRLTAFNDLELADIGLSRGDVIYAVRHGRLREKRGK